MTAIVDLRRFRLRPGDSREEVVQVELEPFHFGGQRYDTVPLTVPVDLRVTQASGALVLELAFQATLSGPCMRCLGHAEVALEVSAREIHDLEGARGDTADEELRSDYVADGRLDVGTWVRDAVALALPEQILCCPDCAGLCPVCGKDLNAEPHEHVGQELDPRWAALQQLRDEL
jgi:uncharacterized protein